MGTKKKRERKKSRVIKAETSVSENKRVTKNANPGRKLFVVVAVWYSYTKTPKTKKPLCYRGVNFSCNARNVHALCVYVCMKDEEKTGRRFKSCPGDVVCVPTSHQAYYPVAVIIN